ncbi:phosphate ABC transporter permease subunit PstC [Sandaracinus amylolyticus]|uniref:Phosphate transport system permease protein n=1 Tax=Sandaracinus amylolyticus TaxID=927083 RepID=A0A0F6YM98_9BACT|nr:phosphate ABC transporter permease subunit PstC [Sandaracinus amylolyticus]AKF11188.1 Phosphate transport system permease protein PstC [Sandaracinus amylolyticus]
MSQSRDEVIVAASAAVAPPTTAAPAVAAVPKRVPEVATMTPKPPLGRGYRAPLMDRIAERVILVLATVAVLAIALIFIFVAKEAIPIFFEPEAQEEISGLLSLFVPHQWPGYEEAVYVWQPVGGTPKYNIVPLFVGTLKITFVGMVFAVPLAVLAAVFVSQYVSPRWRDVLKPAIELLASVPSVVLGFFALMLLATFVQDAFALTYRLNAIVAGIALGLAIAPVVFTVAEDAITSVPKHYEAAALALGARKHQVVLRVVLPAALPGIAAAIILGFGRAIGETMVVLMASGNAAVMEIFDPTTSARTVTATIASELGEVAQGDAHWRVLFLLGAMLFVVTFVLNRFAVVVVERLHKRLTAGGQQ